jgi:hypothetical protein
LKVCGVKPIKRLRRVSAAVAKPISRFSIFLYGFVKNKIVFEIVTGKFGIAQSP